MHPNPHHSQRARASPPPDPELGSDYRHYDRGPPPVLAADAMQPPRLQQSSCCNKLLIISACCVFLCLVLVGWMAVLNLPVVADARHAMQERMAPTQRPVPVRERRPLPAILHRYGMIKRAVAPAKGADPVALAAAFPHWRAADGSVVVEAVVNDLALGIAAVVEQLDPNQELRVLSGLAGPPSAPPPPNPQSEEDQEAEEL